MKVKSLFLSMCALAALASCSQNDDEVTPTGSEATVARVTLQLEGDGVGTRAEEAATETGAAAKNVTVFFFNKTDFLVGKPQWVSDAKTLVNTPLKTTTDAVKLVVIANLVTDQTNSAFKNVNSLAQLKAVDFSSIATSGPVNTVNQSEANLYSAGMGAITMNADGNTGKATVALHFVTARINKVNIKWTADSNTHYAATEEALKTSPGGGDPWFAIRQVYVMTAQTNSPLIPANATESAWTGNFIPKTYAFAGGVAWTTDTKPWKWEDSKITQPVQTDSYLVKPMPKAGTNEIANVIAEKKAWYLFENPNTSTHPTGIIIEIVWKSKADAQEGDYLTKYFTVYFGEKMTGGNQPLLEAGKSYGVALTLTGDFKPGGNAGGGGDTPDTPSVDASITVKVTTAKWNTVAMSKDF